MTLSELVREVSCGGEDFLTRNDVPVIKLMPIGVSKLQNWADRKPGSAIGEVLYIADGFDAFLEDF